MFFMLSKVVGFIVLPSNAIALICGLGLCLMLLRWWRAGVGLLAAGIAALLIFGYSPLSNVLLLTLSERFPAWQHDGRDPDGIIVLGGAVDADISVARGTVEINGSAERVIAALELARRFPKARIVYSGGTGNLIAGLRAEAPVMGQLFEQLGIPRERIVLETRSRTTDENARFTRELVAPEPGERWLLVTSAYHMPRSIGVFRKAGFAVEPYPVDWRTGGWIDAWMPFDKLSAGLARADAAAHEWVGLLVYRMTGRSDAFFPESR